MLSSEGESFDFRIRLPNRFIELYCITFNRRLICLCLCFISVMKLLLYAHRTIEEGTLILCSYFHQHMTANDSRVTHQLDLCPFYGSR